MPMTRYEIRNVYSLADPELVKAADKDDPEALLEGVAMAGLVGVLRQLGDLAEFAAEIFHGLHEEVMATAIRGHGLLARVQKLESDIPSIEREFLSQAPHSDFFLNSGIDWHPNQQSQQNLITKGDVPRFILDSYEECRGPPRLFLLDKFDVGGDGACLKRYTNPSVYKVDPSYENETAAYQSDKRIRKTEKKGSRWIGGETSDASHAKLHQLFLEERVQTGPTVPARRVKLKRRTHKSPLESECGESYVNKLQSSPLDSENGESCIKKLFNSPLDSGSGESRINMQSKYPLDDKHVHAVPFGESSLTLASDAINESRPGVLDNMMSAALGSPMQSRSPCVFSNLQKAACEGSTKNHQNIKIQEEVDEKQIVVEEEIKADALQNGFSSDDVASETDNYMDALATMDSDTETSMNQGTCSDAYKDQLQSQLSDSKFTEDLTASEVGNNSIKQRITLSVDSDTTSTSTDIASPVGTESPPRPFACSEIPFHPRVPPLSENTPKTKLSEGDVMLDTCNDARKEPNVSSDIGSAPEIDQLAILEEVTSNERDSNPVSLNHNETIFSPRRSEGHQADHKGTSDCTSEQSECLPTAVHGLSSFSFVRNLKGDVDNKLLKDTSIPMIPIPHILDPDKVDYAEKNHSTGSVVSKCSPPHAIISHEHPRDVHDADVEPNGTSFTDDVPVAEENAKNSDMYPLPELQIRETGDGVLCESDSVEETKSNNSEIEVVTRAVSGLAVEVETELDLNETESVNIVSVPNNVDKNDGKDLEEDAELKRVDEDSINSEMEAVVLLSSDFDKDEDNGHSTFEDHSVINQLCIIQESIESGEQVKGNKLLVPSETCDDLNNVVHVPDNVGKYDGEDLEDDTELKRREEDSVKSEMETSVMVLLPVDIDKNKGNDHSTFENHSVINQLCIHESIESGEHVEGNKLLVPSDTCDDDYVLSNVDKIDNKDLEDGTHLKGGVDEDPLKSEMDTSVVVLLPVDIPKEDDGLSTFESHSDINQFCTFQESTESGEHVEGNKLLVPSDVCDNLNNDVSSPSSNQKILLGDGRSFFADTEQVVINDLGSQPVDITPCDVSNVKLIDSTSESTLFNEADHNVESKYLEDKIDQPNDQIDNIEALESSPLEGIVDQPNGQLCAGGSQLSQLDSPDHFVSHMKGIEEVTLKSEKEASVVVLLPVDICKEEDNGLSTFASHSDISQFRTVHESDESGEHVEGDKVLFPSDVCDNLSNDVDSPSSNPRILQGDSHSSLAETERVVSHDLCSQPVDITLCDSSSVKLIDSTSESTIFTAADHNLESKSLEVKIDQPTYQFNIIEAAESSDKPNDQPYAGSSQLSHLDSLNHFDSHTDLELTSQHLVQNDNQVIPIHEEDLQSTPESYSVPVSEMPPTMELCQPGSHDINLSDQAKRQSTPPFLGFGILPQIAPVKRVNMPPSPPLPPVQWRMRTHPTDGDQHCDDPFASTNVEPQEVGHSKVDEIGSLYGDSQKSQHDVVISSQMSSPVSCLHTEDHDNSSVSSEAMAPQTDSCSIPTTCEGKVFSPSANTYSPPVADKKPDNIPPIYPSTPNEHPEVVDHSTENQTFEHGEGSSSKMSVPNSSLLTGDHGNSSVSSEAKVIQAAVKIEHSSIITTSDQEVFSPSSNPSSLLPVVNKMHHNLSPVFSFPPAEDPQVIARATVNQISNLDTKNQKSTSLMSLPKPRVHTEVHDRPSASSKAKFAENSVLQAAVSTTWGQENISPSSNPYSSHPVIDEMPNNIRLMKIQQPRSPLIVDKNQLKKVTDGAMTLTPPKVEEHDSILDQIRAKSFKLKPAVQTRPTNIQSPRTNLRVAAILEKANAIRKAFAGSDDDDSDDWSD
ncbi:uncharacterized protein [Rutidosis leptorrhynchoides]|uniref:uncharacterized protein n=1 Tax=Rutidosis leptorrhynchoides TaxID=125765 RepID=UPI003A99A459